MKGKHLGEFEELVLLAVAKLDEDAYAVSVFDELIIQTGRKIILSSVHKTLLRLEDKGFLKSKMGKPSPERGGRSKRLYHVTQSGFRSMQATRELRNRMWLHIPKIKWQGL